jgi:arginase
VERAPEALLAAGLADGLSARPAGRVPATGYSAVRDPATKIMNPQALSDYSRRLADAVAAVLDQAEFPVVLGGRLLDPARHDAGAPEARAVRAAVHRR